MKIARLMYQKYTMKFKKSTFKNVAKYLKYYLSKVF